MINFNFFKIRYFTKISTLLFCFSFMFSHAENIYVSKTGDDTNPGTEAQPFKTIAKASQVAQAGDIIIIGGGTYEELLEPARSGSAGSPITYVFERDYLPGATGGGRTWLNYAPGIPNWNWEDGGSIHFYGGAGFLAWTDYIKTSTNNRVTFDLIRNQNWIPEKHNPGYTGHGVKKGEFFLQGIRQALDYKNEWFYNKNTNTLYVQVEGGGMPANNTVRFRKRRQTIKLNKNFIHIENLAVFGGSIDMIGNNNRLYKVSSFYGNHTLGVINSFDSGRQSVLMTGNSNLIEKCEIAWGAGNGVYDKGDDNRVTNSFIHDFNYLGNYDCVLNTRGAKRGKYTYNTLTRSGKDIIQAYVEGGEYSHNDVSFNNFVADDGGLLYTTNRRNQRSTISYNTFHDSQAREGRFKGTGIYLDNDSMNWDVHHNVVWNTKWTGIQINWNGTNLNIFNNTFCKNSGTMGAWHKAGTAFSNVKVWNNITDKETIDQTGNQEEEVTWEPQSDKQNNLVSKESFVNWDSNNFTLKASAQAVDYGRVINGYTDGYVGAKPDAGAYEYSVPLITGIDWSPIDGGPSGSGCYDLPGENCESCTTPITWYEDIDGDGLGDPDSTLSACSSPSGYVDNNNDSCVTDELNTCTILHEIEGLIQAEDYTAQQGLRREATTDVGGGMNLGYIQGGDYSEYRAEVFASGNYEVSIRVATNRIGGNINLSSDQSGVTPIDLAVTNTGGWQSWETVSSTMYLTQGIHMLRLSYEGTDTVGLFNVNWIEFSTTLSNDTFQNEGLKIYPNPASSTMTIKGLKKSYEFTIYDITGRVIEKVNTLGNDSIKIDLRNYSNGLYLLKDNNSTSIYKFIKK